MRLATSVGHDKVIDDGPRDGHHQGQPATTILTLTIGTVEQTAETWPTVMATIANGGVHHTPYVVQKVVGPDGKVLIDDEASPASRCSTATSPTCEQNMLRGVVTHGTGTNADVAGHTIFGKTGTTDDRADAWFIGANPAAHSSPPRCGSGTAPATSSRRRLRW